MIILKNITLRNFLSTGAVTQVVNLDSKEITLILGENLDLGGDGARNGTGKTTLLQALSYCLFGVPINSIRKDNLINRTNGKNMLVTVEFSSNGTEYKIERGRKPNLLRFFVNNTASSAEEDTAQGENKETQVQIERAIGMTSDMFKHIIALNTYSEPFLSLASGEQRKIIEQLLGITLLSEKAEILKEKIRDNKETIQLEEFRVKAIEEANKRVQEQIEALKRRQNLWLKKHEEDLSKLVIDYDDLSKIDIEAELQAHKDLAVYNDNKKRKDTHDSLIARQIAWKQKIDADLSALQKSYDKLSHIDIDAELRTHKNLAEYNRRSAELSSITAEIATLGVNIAKEQKAIDKLETEIKTLESNTCYACGQDFHTHNHDKVLSSKRVLLDNAKNDLAHFQIDLEKNKSSVFILGAMPEPHYKTEYEAIKHSSELENIQNQIDAKMSESDPYADQLIDYSDIVLGTIPVTHYDTEAEAIEHRSTVANLLRHIAIKDAEVDPYAEQVSDMEKQALQDIDFNKINQLNRTGDHLKFLLDLLTSKDSFVRKKIIDQNLSYLNSRLTNYLDKIGLPHTVIFKNDLSVEITELGRELDFHNLSRGEMNRLILALSFAFRDVWENLYSPINALFIDELIDSGMDNIGLENSLAILKTMTRNRNKSIWLVSHKEELTSRVDRVLKVVKEAGFTSYSTDIEEE